MTDEELILQLQAGKKQAAGLLYERYKRPILGYFYNNTHNKTVSEDLLQLTFEKVMMYCAGFSQGGNLRAWLFQIARNAMIDFYNRDNKNILSIEDNDVFHKVVEENEADDEYEIKLRLKKALQTLSTEKKELIAMVKLQGMQYAEAAKIYNTTEGNIKVRVFRIMKELQENTRPKT